MRAVVQRVDKCDLLIDNKIHSKIGMGLLVLVGIEEGDTQRDVDWICSKINGLRVFDDDKGMMNLDLHEINGDLMIVSQFTLLASTRKGNRPSYIKAAHPDVAAPMYDKVVKTSSALLGKTVATGVFGAHMQLSFINNGPVTILFDSKYKE